MSEYHQQKPPKELHTPGVTPSKEMLQQAETWKDMRMEMAKDVKSHNHTALADKITHTPVGALRTSDADAVKQIKESLAEGLKQHPVGDKERKGINDALYKMNHLDSVTPSATPASAKPAKNLDKTPLW